MSILIGWIGVCTGTLVSIPQAIQIWRTKCAKDVSATTYWLLLVTVICYLVRAVAIREAIFIVSNAINVGVAIVVLALIYTYKGGKSEERQRPSSAEVPSKPAEENGGSL